MIRRNVWQYSSVVNFKLIKSCFDGDVIIIQLQINALTHLLQMKQKALKNATTLYFYLPKSLFAIINIQRLPPSWSILCLLAFVFTIFTFFSRNVPREWPLAVWQWREVSFFFNDSHNNFTCILNYSCRKKNKLQRVKLEFFIVLSRKQKMLSTETLLKIFVFLSWFDCGIVEKLLHIAIYLSSFFELENRTKCNDEMIRNRFSSKTQILTLKDCSDDDDGLYIFIIIMRMVIEE